MREDLLRQFSSADGTNPLADFQAAHLRAMKDGAARQEQQLDAMRERMVEIKLELARLHAEREKHAEVAAEHAGGTAKGRPYEEAVAEALDAIARGQGDDCEAVGDFRGGAGRKGDVVVDIEGCRAPPAAGSCSRPRTPAARKEALRSSTARGPSAPPTTASGGAERGEAAGAGAGAAGVGGDKLVVGYDPEDGSRLALEVAYSLARARVLMAKGGVEGLDAPALARRSSAVRRDGRGAADQAAPDQRGGRDRAGSFVVEGMAERVRAHLAQIGGAGGLADAEEERGERTGAGDVRSTICVT